MIQVAARRNDGKLKWLSWEAIPNLQRFKTLYKTNPNLFIEKEGILYKKTVDAQTPERLRTLLNSCLKIYGTTYALALALSDGDRKGAVFAKTLETLHTRCFQDKLHWIEVFEHQIREDGIKVALTKDGITLWLEPEGLSIQPSTLKSYLSNRPENFERIGIELFLLPSQHILIENMFFRCVELAGGEYALASWLSDDAKTLQRHLKNFERMGFKHAKNFKTYAELFSRYLERNQTLFEEEVIYA